MSIQTNKDWKIDTAYTDGQNASAYRMSKPVNKTKYEINELSADINLVRNKDPETWISSGNYSQNLVVIHNGILYNSKVDDNANKEPGVEGNYWELFSDYIELARSSTSTALLRDIAGNYEGEITILSGGSILNDNIAGVFAWDDDNTDSETDDIIGSGTGRWVRISSNVDDASDIPADTTNFNGQLSSADDTVQKALDTLDDLIISTDAGSITTTGLSNLAAGADVQTSLTNLDNHTHDFLTNVDTVASLRLIIGDVNQVIYLNGYYSLNDGGEGVFKWNDASTTTDDAGIYFGAEASGRWVRQVQSTINIREFGAKGDDSTDDSTAFTNALAYLNPIGGTLYIPNGVYRISSTLQVGTHTDTPVTIEGQNQQKTTIRWNGSTNANIIQLGYVILDTNPVYLPLDTYADKIQKITLTNITIDSTVTLVSPSEMIQIGDGLDTTSVTNIHLINPFIGMTVRSINSEIRNIVITGIADNGIGLYARRGVDNYLSQISINGGETAGTARGTTGLLLEGDLGNGDAWVGGSCEGFWFSDSDIMTCTNSMKILSGNQDATHGLNGTHWIFFADVAFDTPNGDNIIIQGGDESYKIVKGIEFNSCWISNSQVTGAVGVNILGLVDGITFSGGRILSHQSSGLSTNTSDGYNPTNISCIGTLFTGNCKDGSTNPAIDLKYTSNTQINNCRIAPSYEQGQTQDSVITTDANCVNMQFNSNYCLGNIADTASIATTGTNVRIGNIPSALDS